MSKITVNIWTLIKNTWYIVVSFEEKSNMPGFVVKG